MPMDNLRRKNKQAIWIAVACPETGRPKRRYFYVTKYGEKGSTVPCRAGAGGNGHRRDAMKAIAEHLHFCGPDASDRHSDRARRNYSGDRSFERTGVPHGVRTLGTNSAQGWSAPYVGRVGFGFVFKQPPTDTANIQVGVFTPKRAVDPTVPDK